MRFFKYSVSNWVFSIRLIRRYILLSFLSAISFSLFGQVWNEDFTLPDGTTSDNAAPSIWSTDISAATIIPPNDYFEVRSNALSARDIDGEVIWTSESIDIFGAGEVIITFNLSESGAFENSDYVQGYYVLDGGPEVLFSEQRNDIAGGGPIIMASSGLTGSSLIIVIKVNCNAGNEIWTIDDVNVGAVPPLYSLGNGTWTNGNNWGSTPAGPACNCTPNNATDVTIQSGHVVRFNTNGTVRNLTIENGGELRWNNQGGNLVIGSDASIIIESGGFLNGNGKNAAILELASGNIDITTNDIVNGIELEDILVSGSNMTIDFLGSGRVLLNDDLRIDGNSNQINIGSTGDFTLLSQINFTASGTDNVLTNDGTINADQIRFNGDDAEVVNNGSISLAGNIVVVNNSDINNVLTNNAGSTLAFDVLNLNNAPGFQLNNSGTIDQSGRFRNIPASNTFSNLDGALWRYGSATYDTDLNLFTSSNANTFEYNGLVDQDIIIPQDNYWDLTLSGSGIKSAQAVLDINGDLTSSSEFLTSGFDVNVAGDLNLSGVLNATGSTFFLDGADQSMSSANAIFENVQINGTATKQLLQDLTLTGDLTINSTFDAGPSNQSITLGSDFINDGNFNAQQGAVIFNGAADQALSGTSITRLFNFSLDKSAGGFNIESTLEFDGAWDFLQPATVNFNGVGGLGQTVLLSDANRTGRLGIIPSGSVFNGLGTYRRNIPNAAGDKIWRYIAAPIDGVTVESLKQFFPVTGQFNDPSTQAEWPGIPGIVESSPSLYTYDERLVTTDRSEGWAATPPAGTFASDNALIRGTGCAVFIRFDTETTIEYVGTNTNYEAPAVDVYSSGPTGADDPNGWNLIGNPFESPIEWDKVDKPAGVNNEIHFLDNSNAVGQGQGAYIRYVGGVGTPAAYTGKIALGQAFWVRATADATITFKQQDKCTGDATFIREVEPGDLLRIGLKEMEGDGRDEAVIRLWSEATDEFDKEFDANQLKLTNVSVSSLLADDTRIAINSINESFCSKEVKLAIIGVEPGEHEMNFFNLESFRGGMEIQLIDSYLGEAVDIFANPLYTFEVNGDATSFGNERFVLVFGKKIDNDVTIDSGTAICEGENSVLRINSPQPNIRYVLTHNQVVISDTIASNSQALIIDFDNSVLTDGENTLRLHGQQIDCGVWEEVRDVIVTKYGIPESPTATISPVCSGDEVEIIINSGSGGSSFNIYDNQEDKVPFVNTVETSFLIPSVDESRSFWLSEITQAGCESKKVEVEVEVITINKPVVSADGFELKSSQAEGYQWYLDGEQIEGATNQYYESYLSGEYAVEITEGNCTAISEPYVQLISDIYSKTENEFTIFPNPVSDVLELQLNSDLKLSEDLQISIFGIDGQQLLQFSRSPMELGSFNVAPLKPGIYILKIRTGDQLLEEKFVKE